MNEHRKKKNVLHILLIIIYLIFFPVYLYSAKVFWYQGYYQYTFFSGARFFAGTLLVIFFVFYGKVIDSGFVKITYYICLIFLLYGEIVSFVLDSSTSLAMIIIISFFLLLLPVTEKINIDFRITSALPENTRSKIIMLCAVVLFLPFLKYVSYINVENLLLKDIYETRTLFRNNSSGSSILGYIKEPLARVLLPLLLVRGINEKNKKYIVISSLMILYIFLCGGLKSILFGLIATLFFFRGDYDIKLFRIIKILVIIGIAGLLLYYLFRYDLIVSIFRRLFILPARLNKYYVEYFKDNWTYYKHSGISLNQDSMYSVGISNYVGEYVIGTGTNANTGLFVEGYYSFGLFGGIVYLIIPLSIITILNSIKFDEKYYGVFFVYLYYFNTAILSTLLLTHGLLFFMCMALLCMRKQHDGRNNLKIAEGEAAIDSQIKNQSEKKPDI